MPSWKTSGMGNWWSRVCDELHGMETERNAASRLANTPPEFWSPRDFTASRRLRHRYKETFQDAVLKNKPGDPRFLANEKFPEGPFWPRTPRRSPQLREELLNKRLEVAIAHALGLHGDAFGLVHFDNTPEGDWIAWSPLTGRMLPLSHFGM